MTMISRQVYSAEDRRMFHRLFGATLSEYWDNLWGFDIFAFERFVAEKAKEKGIALDDDDSLAGQTQQVFGTDAVNLIFKLLGMPDRWDGKELEVIGD